MSHGEPTPGWIDGVCMKHSYSEGLVCSICHKENMDKLDKAITLLKCVRELVVGVGSSRFIGEIDKLIK